MEALAVGRSVVTTWPVPYLLTRAGFSVDVITTSRLLRLSKFARSVLIVDAQRSIADFTDSVVRNRSKPYDFVVIADDPTLAEFVELERRSGRQSNLLPLMPGASRDHLFSKIGLSRILAASGIRTPPFDVAANADHAVSIADQLGYPVFVKVDSSAAGQGVHEHHDATSITARREVFDRPVLVQKAIIGKERAISAIFLEGKVVYFDYAVDVRRQGRFGPSILRTFDPPTPVDCLVLGELSALGRALGAHGFANISCIDAADGSGRYYFEADMRPNVWADFGLYFGEDAAARIQGWFANRICLTSESVVATGASRTTLTIPHFWRVTPFELATNRYGVWRFIPLADARLVLRLVVHRLSMGVGSLARYLVPKTLRPWLRSAVTAARTLATRTRRSGA